MDSGSFSCPAQPKRKVPASGEEAPDRRLGFKVARWNKSVSFPAARAGQPHPGLGAFCAALDRDLVATAARPEVLRWLTKCFDSAAARDHFPLLLSPELLGRVIQQREQHAPELLPLPLLEPAQSDFVGQGSTSPHQVGETEFAPERSTM